MDTKIFFLLYCGLNAILLFKILFIYLFIYVMNIHVKKHYRLLLATIFIAEKFNLNFS
jgi:hypothetical protein